MTTNPSQDDRIDAYRADRPDVLTWLQGWFTANCNGDWEHDRGISVHSLDNPGWRVRIELVGTALEGRGLVKDAIHRSEDDWLIVWIEDGAWQAACGPLNLGEALHRFRAWSGDIDAR